MATHSAKKRVSVVIFGVLGGVCVFAFHSQMARLKNYCSERAQQSEKQHKSRPILRPVTDREQPARNTISKWAAVERLPARKTTQTSIR